MLIYLASPYTHPNKNIEDRRAKAITIIAGKLICNGHHIFCPVAHCHKMNRYCNLGGKFEYWREFDEKMISVCNELWIATLQDWDKSVGIKAEVEMTTARSMPLRYVDPITLEITREPALSYPVTTVLDHWSKLHDIRQL
jgi:hypothetical protein